jgi:predicted AAA+ superfamily ATPase
MVDLLPGRVNLEYLKNPMLLEQEVRAQSKDKWIILDEIQKVPSLLDEVHNLIENYGHKLFVLSGSSARKLRRGGGNLLAGRAVIRQLFPLTSKELNFSLPAEQLITYGSLPASVNASTNAERDDFLASYLDTYLREEIREEGLVRRLDSFARFMDIAALAGAQVTNIQGIARDSGINRNSVRGFFSILEDTLMGRWLPAYRKRAKVKEVSHPKFYWFDAGVLRAAAGGIREPLPSDWRGRALETWLFHELSAYLHYSGSGGTLSYWRTPSGSEVDFVWQKGNRTVAIEAKASKSYAHKFGMGIRSLEEGIKLDQQWVVYLGEKSLKDGNIHVVPALQFIKLLTQGEII